jgi:hypothetical protein
LLAKVLGSQVERESSPAAQIDICRTPFLAIRDHYTNWMVILFTLISLKRSVFRSNAIGNGALAGAGVGVSDGIMCMMKTAWSVQIGSTSKIEPI